VSQITLLAKPSEVNMQDSAVAYELIGDVHGHADMLEALLRKLGYSPEGRGYRPPHGRRLVFLGDLIDRGPGQLRVLEIARSMVEEGTALCVMGNHEFNAIAYVTPDPSNPDDCYRVNRGDSAKAASNRRQHAAFLAQVAEGTPAHKAWVDWFRSLPVWLDLGGLRAVHGCWDDEAIEALSGAGWRPGITLDDEILHRVSHAPEEVPTRALLARKLLTCGLEISLPEDVRITKDGHSFDTLRIANWRHWASTLDEVALVPGGNPEVLRHLEWPTWLRMTEVTGSPVFLGHHWFTGHPVIESPKIAVLDWSAAGGGKLVAYRWDGEDALSNDKLAWVEAVG
jgi:hypothetical protein